MKRLEIFWNTIHYFDYRFELKIQTLLRGDGNYSHPTSDPEVQKWRDVEKEIFEIGVKDPRYGFSSIMAGNFILGLAAIIGAGVFFILSGFIKFINGTYINGIFIFVCMLPFAIITYYFVFHKDKYLIYFKEFDRKPKEWRRRWKWISFFTIIGIILFLILSLIIMDYLSNIN
ncbi:MAG: hypothetical protein L6262_04895 [Weeksellaceae bacterium]|nr:hypothetical protein [Weeksellaceae bacterium]